MRLRNWQNNLTNLIEKKRETPFDFPTHNCLMWAFDAIEAVTGDDLSGAYRGKYKTEKAAATLLRKVDKVKTSLELLEKLLGPSKSSAFARPGDIVFVNSENDSFILGLPEDTKLFGPVPGVCYGYNSYFVGETGLIAVETLRLGKTIWVS